jgi:hypothetical protein
MSDSARCYTGATIISLLIILCSISFSGCGDEKPAAVPVTGPADVITNLMNAGLEVQVSLVDPSPGPYAERYAARCRTAYKQINDTQAIEASFWKKENARLAEIEALADGMGVTVKQLSVSGEIVDILEYKNETSAMADIEYIKLYDVTTFSIQAPTENGLMDFTINGMRAGPSHYYHLNNIIVLYVERPIADQPINKSIKTALEKMFGPPFYTV